MLPVNCRPLFDADGVVEALTACLQTLSASSGSLYCPNAAHLFHSYEQHYPNTALGEWYLLKYQSYFGPICNSFERFYKR